MKQKSGTKRGVHQTPRTTSTGGRAGFAAPPVKLANAGQELLRGALECDGFSVRKTEELTGISKAMLSGLLRGTKLPGLESRDLLWRMFGVPPSAWDHSPGWRPAEWQPRGSEVSGLLTAWAWCAGMLVPTAVSWTRLQRDYPGRTKTTPTRVDELTATVWRIVSPELQGLSPETRSTLGLVEGRAAADALRGLVEGLLKSCIRGFDKHYDALCQAGALHCVEFLNDIGAGVSDLPGVAA